MTALPFNLRQPLPRASRREVLIGSLALAVTAASELMQPRRMFARLSQDQLDAAIPKRVGAYRFASSSGLILPAGDELSQKLYDQVLTRVYQADGLLPIMALFAYGSVQNLSLELHRPEECYPQQGFTITEPQPVPLVMSEATIPASVLTARRANGYVEQVLFWSRIGTHFPESRTAQSILVARENFAGRVPDGLLVRLSVPTPDLPLGLQAARSFTAELDHALSPRGRTIVFGDKDREDSLP
ncbi:EpsI family protein [Novosphingobium chloroacetimidivorans]|uniref:EpsI family protein n=1 Tax=Novosphingobium chloroacetimidivorans TaxID=1428314 RepID=A0A7W7NVS1_9SPHN|nr:exosortase C-terminal domain/associated protein EpsI [Novosphingobium chloroacetimidivorans]MBB4857390.1 EpsI family protein [Novosphingobium chloroacetimidivorans]